MSNTLYKQTQRVLVDEGTPGAPDRDVKSSAYLCGYYPRDLFEAAVSDAAAAAGGSLRLDENGVPRNIGDFLSLSTFLPESVVAGLAANGAAIYDLVTYVCANVVTYTRVSGTAPVPPTYEERSSQAWDSVAVSLGSITGAGYVEFNLGPAGMCNVGVQLTDASTNPYFINGTEISQATLPLFLNPGWLLLSVFQQGTQTAARTPSADLAFGLGTLQAHAPTDVYRIQRVGTVLKAYRNGVELFPQLGNVNPLAELRVVGQLYSSSAYVDNPEIVLASESTIVLPALQAIGGQGAAYSGANVELPAVFILTRAPGRASLALPALRAVGSGHEGDVVGSTTYAQGEATLPPLTAYAYGGLPVYQAGDVILPPLIASAHGVTGEIGGATLTLPPALARGSDRIYGEARLVLPAVRIESTSYEGPNGATMRSLGLASAQLTTSSFLAVSMNSAGAVTSVMAVGLLLDAELRSAAGAATSLAAQQLLDAVMNTVVGATANVPAFSQDSTTWVVNLDSLASTTYKAYDYNSFAAWGGAYLGARAGGLYVLDGDDDAGAPIAAMVSFGKHDFETTRVKRPTQVYLGVSSTDRMFLKVVVDDTEEYIYEARDYSESLRQQRVDVGRGIRANYLTFELYNNQGCDFELDSVEFMTVKTSRRL